MNEELKVGDEVRVIRNNETGMITAIEKKLRHPYLVYLQGDYANNYVWFSEDELETAECKQ